MTTLTGQDDYMVVNSAELKTHLGRYLRTVEQDAVTLEVRVRDRTVAYMVPAKAAESLDKGVHAELALKRLGIEVDGGSRPRKLCPLPEPVLAGDGRDDVVTVAAMREGRDW